MLFSVDSMESNLKWKKVDWLERNVLQHIELKIRAHLFVVGKINKHSCTSDSIFLRTVGDYIWSLRMAVY